MRSETRPPEMRPTEMRPARMRLMPTRLRWVRTTLLGALFIPLVGGVGALAAQGDPARTSAEPFKVGTFEIDGAARVGIVLRDQLIVDLDAANAALQRDPSYPKIPMPDDMVELISRYEYGLQARLYEIVNDLVADNRLAMGSRPDFMHDVEDVRTLPPILYPGKILQRCGQLLQPRRRNRYAG